MTPKARAAFLAGLAAAFVVALLLVRVFGAAVLFAPERDPGFVVYRFVLGLGVLAGAGGAGVLGACVFLLWADRSPEVESPVPALHLSRPALLSLAFAALALGAVLRFADLEGTPASMWIDDVSLIRPALALTGSWSDFADSIRPAPSGVARPFGSVGVLYLEAYRASLKAFGTTVFGVRFPAAAAGALSVLTVFLLARSLLPPGGATLAALVFAGLRWSLIVSRWGWVAVFVGPIADVAALLLLAARRQGRVSVAAAAGAVAGIAAHVYLAAWCVAAALLGLALWPSEAEATPPLRRRAALALAFAAAFAVVAAPLFLFREGRTVSYFARASQQTRKLGDVRAPWPALADAADALAAPWFLGDPEARHDLPGRSRLGWLLGIPVAVALGRALCRPAEETSGFFFCHAGAAFAASVASGGVPNGFRFAYLADVAAIAAAAGLLLLTSRTAPGLRRGAALAAVGIAAISSAAGARDALLRWPERCSTFQGFRGQDTLLGRAAIRWERYGDVEVGPLPIDSPITFGAVVRYRLDPDVRSGGPSEAPEPPRRFRLASAAAIPSSGERRVEIVRDVWGKEWGIVFGRRTESAAVLQPTRTLVRPANSSSEISN